MSKSLQVDNTTRVRIDKCFAVALAKGAASHDIAISIKSAHGIVSKLGISLLDYYSASHGATETIAVRDDSGVRDLEKNLDRVREQLAAAEQTISRLEKEISDSTIVEAKPSYAPQDGFYSYDVFYSALLSHLGTPKRALSLFSEKTGYTSGKVQSWRRNDKVPASAFDVITSLEREAKSFHQPLTGDHKRRIDRLSMDGNSDQQIADTMNVEFGDRTFNVNMIKGAKTQIRASFLEDLCFDGKSKEETKQIFLQRYPSARSVDTLIDKAFAKNGSDTRPTNI